MAMQHINDFGGELCMLTEVGLAVAGAQQFTSRDGCQVENI